MPIPSASSDPREVTAGRTDVHTTNRDDNDSDVMDPETGQGSGDNYDNNAYVEGADRDPLGLSPDMRIDKE